MAIAIIPARGGSKRIPGKNIRPFCGRPIIAYPIEVALRSGLFDKVIVSTDSDEIAAIAHENGAEVPFRRPAHLADDFATTSAALLHALEWLRDRGEAPRHICCIYPTAPLLKVRYLREGYKKLISEGCATVFSVTTFPFPLWRALKVNSRGRLEMFWPQYKEVRSNDLPEAYHDAGQFYWVNVEKFFQEPVLYSSDSMPVVIPRRYVQDIDTEEDWKTAEAMYRALFEAEEGND